MQRLKISREGVILIKSFEGFRPHAVRRDDGQWVIGYGHTLSAREGGVVSEADAELLLQFDLIPVAKALNTVSAPLNQHQFDALASFAFSVGLDRFESSDVLSRLVTGSTGEAADAIAGWSEPAPSDAPLRRRAAERALFVADPARPVALADLLSAPLPPPPVAVASVEATDAEVDVVETPAVETSAVETATVETEATVEPTEAPSTDAVTDIVPELSAAPVAFVPAETILPEPVLSEPAHEQTVTPVFASAFTDTPTEPTIEAPIEAASEPVEVATPAPFEAAISADASSAVDGELLVQSPLDESSIFPAQRLVWPHAETSADQTPLFEGDGALRLGAHQMIRHEVVSEEPRRIDWRESGLYILMGAFGLVTFGMSMVAFRRASLPSGGSEFTTIAWVLAVFGCACIAVSAWNLYRKLGRPED